MKQFGDNFKMRLMSQLISGISKVLQKLRNCFNGTAISTTVVLPSAEVFPVILILDLNDSEFIITAASSCQ